MKKIIFFIVVFISLKSNSQIGGTKTYRFLDIPMTARSAALGGNCMSIWGDDINLIYSNPSLLNTSMIKHLALNYCSNVSDLKFGYAAYAFSIKKIGSLAASIQFYDYGKFDGYDELGQPTKEFNANDYSLNLTYSKPLADSLFNIGVSLKTIISQYDDYQSFGNVIDFGVTYHTKKDLTFSLIAKNIGFIWKNYSTNENQVLPQTIQIGSSYKPKKAPFKIFFVYDQVLKWNLKYISPIDTVKITSSFGNNSINTDSTSWQKFSVTSSNFIDNLMRHITIGTELMLSKNFTLRLAYNHRIKQEFSLAEGFGINGISFGFGLNLKRFGFSYSFSKMAFPGNSSIFGITTRL